MLKKFHIGVGATCSVLKRPLHPKKIINNNYLNIEHNERLGDLFIIGEGVKAIKSKGTNVIFFNTMIFPT